ncbi:MAG TPA: glycosyltransferase family 39 protein [Terriglobales bacterium]|nr:glycosyltransferase family 39 protein [Terriglobales bacterium]
MKDGADQQGKSLNHQITKSPNLFFLFALIFTAIFLLHAPLLRLPYFWDEAGYYVPAARDVLLHGSLVPQSTLTSGHPPLVMAWLALWWKLSGYTVAVARTAMLLIAAFALLGVFQLGRRVANSQVALAAAICTALYPPFFSQSAMLHIDLPAGAFTVWGLYFYLQDRRLATITLFSLAALAKETAIVAPLALFAWELFLWVVARRMNAGSPPKKAAIYLVRGNHYHPLRSLPQSALFLLAPLLPLGAWYAYHYSETGYLLAAPEYFRYNVAQTLHPLRMVLSFIKRIWHLLGFMHMFLLTAGAAIALRLPPLSDEDGNLRPRIAPAVQMVFAVVIAAYVVMLSVVGGAPLVRYLLPVVPLVILLCVSTLWRRVAQWKIAVAVVCAGFVLALVINPPYPFAPEDNLAYRDFILLHRQAADVLTSRYPTARVLTAWPATDELSKPYLGYVQRALPVVPIEDFSAEHLLPAARDTSLYDVGLLFSTKYEPAADLLRAVPFWERWQKRFFHFHRNVPPQLAAQLLGGRLVFEQWRRGQWVAIVEIERPQNAAKSSGDVASIQRQRRY